MTYSIESNKDTKTLPPALVFVRVEGARDEVIID